VTDADVVEAIVGSAVLYQEFRDETISRFVNFAFGVRPRTPTRCDSFADFTQIATTFLGVHLLTSYSSPPSHRKHPSRPIRSVPSLTVLPQVDEHTPLFVPATPRRDSVEQDVPAFSAGSLGRLRLTKRTSTGDFTPTLGISSQAGFLLMATTPPSGQAAFGNRARSMSRGGGGFQGGGTAGEGDEEQAGRNRRSSLPLPGA
jgi:hypothetical protein